MYSKFYSCIGLVASALFCVAQASAATVTLDDTSRGAYDNATNSFATAGSGTAAGNYMTGIIAGDTYRSFFTFNLTGVTGSFTGAQFEVSTLLFGEGTSPVTLDLYAYSGSSSSLDAGTAGAAGFAGLGSGTLIGTASISPAMTSTATINLNAAGLASIQAAEGGLFSIGGGAPLTGTDYYLFGGSLNNPPTALVLTTAVTPSAPEISASGAVDVLVLLGGSLVLLGNRKRFA